MKRRESALLLTKFAALALALVALWQLRHWYGAHQTETAARAAYTSLNAAAPAQFVGTKTCSVCHAKQAAAWRNSHHRLAMQPANPTTVLAPFHGERFSDGGVTSTFSQAGGHFYVQTDGPDGRPAKFEIAYTFGLWPLQQYLIPLPNGAMQAFGIAWDARPKQAGGQRWFHLHAGEHLHAGDPLHWSGRQNNWNTMCADCHTTGFRKGYHAETASYGSSWSELGVGCESCHGPGSAHLAWAGLAPAARATDHSHGLAQTFDARTTANWKIDPMSGNAVPDTAPPAHRKEVELCARCHAHRSQIAESDANGQALLDAYVPSLIENSLFWNDGQMKAEVFNYASFEQSKMFQKGVSCSDCHDPHSQKLRLPGNATCLQCHAAAKYDAPAHHFHKMNSGGASCAACHMSTVTYMGVDPRHDHGIRVPRPDLSLKNGTPNACNHCHADRPVAWAARWAQRWYPNLQTRPTPLADALQAAERGDADSLPRLLAIATDQSQAPVVRASTIARLAQSAQPLTEVQFDSVRAQLGDADPLVRRTAIETISGMNVTEAVATQRASWLRPLLSDPVKGVRIAAARALAGTPTEGWSAHDRDALARVTDEYIAAQRLLADRPESYNNVGMLYADQGDWSRAEAELKKALRIAPDFSASAVNLADVYRLQGRDEEGAQLLAKLIAGGTQDATVFHALGLCQLRLRRQADALASLRRAAQLQPANAHFASVYALALDAGGDVQAALQALKQAIALQPTDREAAQVQREICAHSQKPGGCAR